MRQNITRSRQIAQKTLGRNLCAFPRPRLGFTLVELLVVIAIIGVLIALLLPAVQAAREAARRMSCSNNLKQLGVAMHVYLSANEAFPAGKVQYGMTNSPYDDEDYSNWAVAILPYIEASATFDQYDQYSLNRAAINEPVLASKMAFMRCPSDLDTDKIKETIYLGWDGPGNCPPLAPGSYRGLAGIHDSSVIASWACGFAATASAYAGIMENRGLLHFIGVPGCGLSQESPRTIRDGLSHTLMIGESHNGQPLEGPPVQQERRVYWASSWRYHNLGELSWDPATLAVDVDDCFDNISVVGWLCVRAFASHHAGSGVNYVMCDGSVQTIFPSIDPSIYLGMGTIAGNEINRFVD